MEQKRKDNKKQSIERDGDLHTYTHGELNRKKGKRILISVGILVIMILLGIFALDFYTNKQSSETIGAIGKQSEETNAEARAASYNIYGEEPFTEEYSIGAFAINSDTEIRYGSGFARVGKEKANGMAKYIGTNTSKNSNVYRDAIDGFQMGTTTYDVRTYFWLIEGDDFLVFKGVNYGGYSRAQSVGDEFDDGYQSKDVETVIGMEIHFYESGTLKTSNPKEVSVKGIGSFTDIDQLEGYKFMKGVNNSTGIYLTSDTTIISASEIASSGLTNPYTTSVTNGWFGKVDNELLPNQILYYEFDASPSSPLTVNYYSRWGYQSALNSSTYTVTYHIVGEVPSGVTYPEDPVYVATYGTYTFEDSLSVSGYDFTGWNLGSINGENVSGKTISPVTGNIDVYGKFTMDISVKKTWSDGNDQDGIRPSSVTVTLYDNGRSTGKTLTLRSSNNWSGTFTDLDVSSDYSVKEQSVSGYMTVVIGNATSGFTVVNTHITETIDIPVTKVWNDNNNQDGKRPSSVRVTLYANGRSTWKTLTLSSSNNWKGTFSDVAKNSEGEAITYSIQETSISDYSSEITGTATSGFTVTNTHTPETINIPVTKVWDDNNNQDGIRPTTARVTLYANGTSTGKSLTLSSFTSWKGTFSNVDKYSSGKEISYTVRETDVSEYTASVSGSATSGFTVTNTHTPETIDISVSKIWSDNNDQDGKRPTSVTVTLYANGASTGKTLTLNNYNSWRGTFYDVNKNSSGRAITYTVQENAISGYVASVSGSATSGFTITNTHTPETISIPVSKTWSDNSNQDGIRPTSVTVTLYANGRSTGRTVILNSSNSWRGTFSNVDRYSDGIEITYTVQENSVSGYTASTSGNSTSGFTITNTHTPETISIPVSKTWSDNNNQDGKRPTSVTVTLYANGKTTGKTLTLNSSNSWKGTFSNVDKYSAGTTITYTVQENSISDYTASISGNSTNGFTITNTHTPETIDIPVNKVWSDNNNQDGKRPTSVTVTLYANNSSTGRTVTLNSSNGWRSTFLGVAKYSGGRAITYTVQENSVSGYSASITGDSSSGFTVTNTHTPETTSVTVTKIWNHTNNEYTIPKEVKIQVKNGSYVVAEKILNSSNKTSNENTWQYTFTNLPKYQNQGQEINYTIDEVEVNKGDLKYYKQEIDGTTIRNTYNGPIIKASKEIKTENSLNYVVEGEKITYTIRIRNSGEVGQNVLVKDSAPEGTTFVTGSIKINGVVDVYKTEYNLSNGITVNVPALGETTVSFDVTVNNLAGNTLTKTISNTATVNKNPDDSESPDDPTNEVTTTVNKADLKYSKTSTPTSGSTVKKGDEITYTIHLDNTEGKAPTTAIVKDNIPEGTTFVAGSIKIGGASQPNKTADDLKNGISVDLATGESKNLEFKVTVNDLNNGATIQNVATVNDNSTNKTEHNYVEAVITASKEIKTANNLNYVVEGEKITYTIRIKNSGDLAQNVLVKDSAPEGTTFVVGSIKINGQTDAYKTEDNLINGITINVPATREATVSFEVTVNSLEGNTLTKTIVNTATVNKNTDDPNSPDESTNEVTTTVNKADLKYSKSSNPASGSTVKEGDEITYTIHLDNTSGKAPTTAVVKDNIPEGTTFMIGSIKVGGEAQESKTAEDLRNGISVNIGAGESKDVEFKVTVNDIEDEATINNVATVNDKNTNETEHKYAEAILTTNKEIKTEKGLNYVAEGEKITYTIKVENTGTLSQDVIIKDSAPEGTTFIDGSIKINGEKDESKTSENLANGITINVPSEEESSISFEVTVNVLEGSTLTKTIANTATVNKNPEDPTSPDEPTNEVTTTVNKAALKYNKSSNPANGSTVKEGDEITYTIHLDNTEGKAKTTAVVKDNIPEGTTFVNGSIKIGGEVQSTKTADDLKNGISVDLVAGESKDVEFKVTVDDFDNGATIKNVATVNDQKTNETEHNYVEPILTINKAISTENSLSYVVEGEKITYTIKVQNSGGLAQNVVIKDSAPEGTTFVNGSIKVNGEIDESKTAENLANGITVNVPSKGEASVSFEVTVNELEEGTLTKTIANTATVNKNPEDPTSQDEQTNEVTIPVNKADLKYSKSSNPASGSIVKEGDEITYTIHLDNTSGKAPTTGIVKDTIPEGTTFITGSIKVNGQIDIDKTEEDLKNGISVDLSAGDRKDVEFKVTVNDLDNGATIKNVATVNDNSTNEIEHKYVEAIITASKEIAIENGLNYVVEGEKITYTVRVRNTGSLAQDVIVKDNIPEGTTFVAKSIKVNGKSIYNINNEDVDLTAKTAGDLASGITVNIPEIGETTVSFEVTVNVLEGDALTKTIVNTATINKDPDDPDSPDEPTNEVTTILNKANLKYSKSSIPASGTEVKVGDEITYTIHLDNTEGEAPITGIVKDNIPEGTTFVERSIKVEGEAQEEKNEEDLKNGISVDVGAGESKDVEFKVTVNDLDNGVTIKNVATVNDNPTNETEHNYAEAVISAVKEMTTENGLDYVEEGEKVTYSIRISNNGNLAKTVAVKDILPVGITFDEDTKILVGNEETAYTEQDLKNGISVEVPENGSIEVIFAGIVDKLEDNEYSKTLINQATVDNEPTNEVTTEVRKANIIASKESDPASGSKVKEGDEITYRIRVRNNGTKEGQATIKDNIPEGTTFIEGSIKIDDIVDSNKTATDLQNGIVLNVTVEQERVIEFKVTVDKLADGTTIKNTAYINQSGEDEKIPEEPEHTYVEPKEEQSIVKTGTRRIENLDDEITYDIVYNAKITDYEGKAKVKVVDELPYTIDEEKSDIAGGTYDEASKTIIWEEAVENIQMTEEKEVTVNKTIKVVYKDVSQDVVNIKNIVTGHIEYETPDRTSDEVIGNWTTTTGFTVNIPVSKIWEDDSDKLSQRPTKVIFKLTGSDESQYTKELAKPGTPGSETTQDSSNSNKWNDIFENLPKYDNNNQEITYTLTELSGDLKYYDASVDDTGRIVTNTNKYGKVTVHYYIMNTDGSTTTTRVPDTSGTEIPDVVIEGKEGDPYAAEEATNVNDKYELVEEKLPENSTGTIEKYDEEKPQEVIYYYRLKPAKVIVNYLEKDEDTDDSNNQVLTAQEQIEGHVDDTYNTNTDHRKETITNNGRTYTLVEDSGNTEGTMTVEDTNVTYYYLQNTKATVRYVERDPETHEIVKDLEEPYTQEGLVGDKFVTNAKAFIGYKLVESPEQTTIEMTKEEQTLIYYYEPVYTGLVENHIDDKTGKILYTEIHNVQVGQNYDIPSKEFAGYDLVESKLPDNSSGTMGEDVVTVNYYYIKKAVLEVNYIDKLTGEPLTEQIVDKTKHEGDEYTTEQKTFEDYDLVEVPSNATGTMKVETDEEGNITNNKTVVTYYYVKKSAGVEEHHIDILTGKEIEEPILHEGHIGDEYNIPSKEFLSYQLVTEDEEGNSMLPTNSTGTMAEEKIVVNYYYNQPAKVIVHYVEKATGKEIEEINPETGELQSSQEVIEGFNQDEYETTAKEFEYYTLIEKPEKEQGKMKVEITKDEEGNDIVNNTIELYYYYKEKPFNIGVEKEITGIIINGKRRTPENGKIEKVEIYRKNTENTSVQIEYKIKVFNSGEVNGNATIEENIPEGMKLANNDGTWEEQDGKLIKIIPEIKVGETKEYTVLLNWEQTEETMGEKANEVKLVEMGNVPGFEDNNEKDNTSNANIIISVETGELPIGLILALVALVGLETVTLRYAVVLTKRQKKVNKK